MKPKTGEIIFQYNQKPGIKPIEISKVMNRKSLITLTRRAASGSLS